MKQNFEKYSEVSPETIVQDCVDDNFSFRFYEKYLETENGDAINFSFFRSLSFDNYTQRITAYYM